MNALPAAPHCADCNKPLRANNVHKVGFEFAGQPEKIVDLCRRCALRFARNVVRLERAQGLREVLQA